MTQDLFDFTSIDEDEVVEIGTGEVRAIMTVSEVVTQARDMLRGVFTDIWVVGEISGCRPAPSGHYYFSIKDEHALLSLVMFRGVASKLPFEPKDGMEVVVRGTLTIYPKSGKFQMEVQWMEPKGVGALQMAFEQMKAKLADEGLFNSEYKKPLPFLPKRIGVVTSPTGAAVRDIIQVARRRFPTIDILLAPVRVQGEGSAAEVAEAIALLDGQVDVMIVGRGGGSIEDLWAFNEEIVARAIFDAQTPIVSAVGHEIDFTIADFVADVRAPTPSAAAELVVPRYDELLMAIADRHHRLATGLMVMIERARQRHHDLYSRLRPPTTMIAEWVQHVDDMRDRMAFAINKSVLEPMRAKLGALSDQLHQLSPLAVLGRGYAVLQTNGHLLRSVKAVRQDDVVTAKLADGQLTMRVNTITTDEV